MLPARLPCVATGAATALKGSVIVSFEAGERRIEDVPARDDDDIEARSDLVTPEHFPHQALRAVADDGAAQLSRGRNPEARPGVGARQDEDGHQSPVLPSTRLVDPLKFCAPADVTLGAEAVIHGLALPA